MIINIWEHVNFQHIHRCWNSQGKHATRSILAICHVILFCLLPNLLYFDLRIPGLTILSFEFAVYRFWLFIFNHQLSFLQLGMSLVYILVIVLSTVLMPYLARSVSSSGSCCKSSGLSGQHCVQLQLRLVPFIVSGESVRSTPPRSVINLNNRVPYCIFGHSNDYKH